jgi:hypothetical protein
VPNDTAPQRSGQRRTREPDRYIARAGRPAPARSAPPEGCSLDSFPEGGPGPAPSATWGIVLAVQARWTLPALIAALERMLCETQAGDWIGQVRGLSLWRAVEE